MKNHRAKSAVHNGRVKHRDLAFKTPGHVAGKVLDAIESTARTNHGDGLGEEKYGALVKPGTLLQQPADSSGWKEFAKRQQATN